MGVAGLSNLLPISLKLTAFRSIIDKEALSHQHLREISNDSYTQSVRNTHEIARIRLLNHYLRKDIKSGKQGLGHLMNVQNRQTIDELSALTSRLRKMKRRLIFWRRC